jgi:hypothetical protein
MKRARTFARSFAAATSGVAIVEFALSLPMMLIAGLWGVETANFAITNMRVSQLAEQIADNASRVGDTSTLDNRRIFEADINDLLKGANIQSGDRVGLFERGRVIISSLEVYEEARHCPDGTGCPATAADEGEQFIHWQRCAGKKNFTPQYGGVGDAKPGGMGRPDEKVNAIEGSPVMYVEVAYDYDPIVANVFLSNTEIYSQASFMVRDDRDVKQVYQRVPGSPDPVADCAVFDNPFA